MPKLWNATIEAHRAMVREAILDTAWRLVTATGLASVTMSQIAEQAGIGRATLYKYFPDVGTILSAWHERHVAGHLEHLSQLGGQPGDSGARLQAVLQAYALIAHHRGRHDAELVAFLHTGQQIAGAQHKLVELVRDLLAEGAAIGEIRVDLAPEELAAYCLHALTAASGLQSETAVARLVAVTLAGLRPSP